MQHVGIGIVLIGEVTKKIYMSTEIACRYLGINAVNDDNLFLDGDSIDCPHDLKEAIIYFMNDKSLPYIDLSIPQFGEKVLRVSRPKYDSGFSSFFYCEVSEKCTPIIIADLTEFLKPLSLLKDFVANVSHEIRTPVTAMEGALETLLDGAISQPREARFFVNLISRQVERLAFIFEDMLLLSKIEAQHTNIVTAFTPIRGLITEVIEYVSARALEKSITIKIECDEKLEVILNERLMFQAISNLIVNAIKFSKVASLIIVQAKITNSTFILRIVDSGIGIAPEHVERIFERFYRVDSVRNRRVGGTGLGLAIVDNVVKAHGGQVRVASKLGVGSTFTISIPLKPKDGRIEYVSQRISSLY